MKRFEFAVSYAGATVCYPLIAVGDAAAIPLNNA